MRYPPELPGLAFHALLHLLVIGTLVRLAVAVALNGAKSASPRTRYAITLIGFAAAVVLPLAVQTGGLLYASKSVVLRYDEATLVEAGRYLGTSSQWPLRPPLDDLGAWWLWASIGEPSQVLLTVWWIGILALVAGSALGWLVSLWQRRRWTEAPDALRRALDWPVDVPLFTGPRGTPLATGLWRPRVYLPRWAATDLESTALSRIARHELAHVRWRDPLVDRGVRMMRGLLWPAWPLWSLTRVIRREREAAADHEALNPEAATPARDMAAIDYAETLMIVAARRNGLMPLVGATGELEDRVRRLLRPAGRVPRAALVLTAIVLALGVGALVAMPLPTGDLATVDATDNGEDVRNWGPLDHLLGYNPVIEVVVAPGVNRVNIQGHELDAEDIVRWHRSTSLEGKATMVREAEEKVRRRQWTPD